MKKNKMARQKVLPAAKIIESWKQSGIVSGVAAIILSLLAIWFALSEKSLLLKYSTLGYFGLLVSNFVASAAIFFPVPTLATSFLSGNILNPIYVGVFAGVGSALGDFVAFLLGFGTRSLVNGFLKKEHLFGKLEFWFKKNALLTIFVLSFIPNPFFDGVGLIAGAFSVRPRDFFLATVLGRVARNILLAFSGQKILS